MVERLSERVLGRHVGLLRFWPVLANKSPIRRAAWPMNVRTQLVLSVFGQRQTPDKSPNRRPNDCRCDRVLLRRHCAFASQAMFSREL